MDRRSFIVKCGACFPAGLFLKPISFNIQNKKVTLLGDSIRLGYQPYTSLYLMDKVETWGPQENCGNTVDILANASQWIRDQPADIFHINAGLHDLKIIPYDSHSNLVPLKFYEQNVERIIRYVHETCSNAIIIWATTTPVLDEKASAAHREQMDFRRINEDVIKYNENMKKVVGRMGLPVNDLYDFVMSGDPEGIMLDDGVHFTKSGYEFLGEQVADAIKIFL